MMQREFDLSDVLTITTGRLVSLRHMDGVYDILAFMAGEPIYTHQIRRVCEEAAPVLLAQHPRLAEVEAPESFESEPAVREWIAEQKARLGDTLLIAPMTIAEHERIDPVSELAERIHPDRIITL